MYEPGPIEPTSNAMVGERRESIRHLAIMRVATLRTVQGQELCLVRNISQGGLKARIWSHLDVGDSLSVRFKSDHHVRGHVVWRQDEHIGMEFLASADVVAILRGDEVGAPTIQPRAPRVQVEVPAQVRIGARYYRVMLRDISQGGAKVQLAAADRLEGGDPSASLMLTDFPPIEGSLRWHNRDVAGIWFHAPISLDALAQWIVAQRQ